MSTLMLPAGVPGSVAERDVHDDFVDWSTDSASLVRSHVDALPDRPCYPGSAAQKRFWVLDQIERGNPSLNIAVRWALEGSLDADLLEQAFQQLIARHEILRTSFSDVEGQLVQTVEAEIPFAIRWVSLTTLPQTEVVVEAERIAREEARLPFDLHAPPPFLRVSALRIDPRNTILLLTVHHIVCDGWSIGLMAREVGEFYAALRSGRLPRMAALPVSYGEYCAWMNEVTSLDLIHADEAFWLQTMRGAQHFEMLPDKPRPPMLGHNGNIVSRMLPRALSNGLMAMSQREGCTFFVTALSILLTLLHRHTGEVDISIGTQVAGRNQVEVEELVGLFINTLVLRNDLSGDPSFNELLHRVGDGATDAFDHAALPLEKLIEILRPPRDMSRNPLFSINFVVQRSFVANEHYADLRLTDLPSYSAGPIYELNFFVVERPEGWRLSCEYNSDLFEAQTVTQLLKQYQNLMEAVVVQPERALSALPLLDANERERLLTALNPTTADYPRDKTVVQLFQQQVARTPDVLALVSSSRRLTYQELDSASTQLALRLRQHVPETGGSIGLLLGRSVDLLVAMLAIHKIGCAYVPLDPRHPAERLRHILSDVRVAALITDGPLDARLPLEQAAIIHPDADGSVALELSPLERIDFSTSDELAYIIYTSGSTGQPKGVEVGHQALVNLLSSMQLRPGLCADDVLLAVTTVSFDIAALELLLPLIVGARVVMASDDDVTDGQRLQQLIDRHGVTVMQATPASWQLLLESGFQSWPGFKMLVGGEGLPRALANRLLEGGGELWNMYGPTETTIWSSCEMIERDERLIGVGRPIANTQFYILDSHDALSPPGAPGQLHIGGEGLARGYHHKLQLTADKFIDNPLGQDLGQGRIYRTGDLARWLPDGSVQILGRLDDQIKLRGFRIEPGDIEAVLRRHPDIVDAVVILGEDARGDGALWAYVTARHSAQQRHSAVIAELRSNLLQALPGYMRPASITLLDAMPRTQNGKLDRRALPVPKPMMIDLESGGGTRLFTDTEHRLAVLWNALLGEPVTDRRENFFELGGHSLLAARLLNNIDTEFGRRFSLSTLFTAPTLGEQAALLISSDAREYDFRQVVRLQMEGRRQPLLAINNTGIFFGLSKLLGADQPFTTLQLFDPTMAAESAPTGFSEIAAEYVQLIRRVQPQGPYALMGWCVAGALAFEIARQLNEDGQTVSQLILIDAYVPGYTGRLGPVRAALSEYSYRWKLIALDWSKVRNRQLSLGSFLRNRAIVQKVLALFGRARPITDLPAASLANLAAPELYDQWLLNYLRESAAAYVPLSYAGKVTLFRSADEPSGHFLDWQMGWGQYAAGGIDVIEVEGDHFSIFQNPGLSHMAAHISAQLDTPFNRLAR